MGPGESGRGLCPVCRVRKAHSVSVKGRGLLVTRRKWVWAGPVPGRGVSREKHSL